jgi:hypothetical protein
MRKIKIFTNKNGTDELERRVNDFLEEIKGASSYEIRFTESNNDIDSWNCSVLIFYVL